MFIEDMTYHTRRRDTCCSTRSSPTLHNKKLEVFVDDASRCAKQNGFRNLELRSSKRDMQVADSVSTAEPSADFMTFFHRQQMFQHRLLEYMRAARQQSTLHHVQTHLGVGSIYFKNGKRATVGASDATPSLFGLDVHFGRRHVCGDGCDCCMCCSACSSDPYLQQRASSMNLLLRQTHTELGLQGVPSARLHLTMPSCRCSIFVARGNKPSRCTVSTYGHASTS